MSIVSTRIQPCLWFDDQLEEAVRFYTSIFPSSSIGHLTPLVGEFTLDGLTFRAINGGPDLRFSEAVSFAVTCADQTEVDYYWDSLVDGGEESACGLYELVTDPDRARREAATRAMLGMRRLVVRDLEAAADAASPAASS
ncbi:putative 3-demethylubiquinone-9 3-methyltransferase (glyoxalase superfamily) [Nocardioides sp. J9]|uniref:VOC family protein n=1 Tax=Nocardioides sp. J9 TaxID=935844 RepID=UPI00119F86A0|nr:VOC family protein [Nocardioides sp. J9]TWH01475.1 putative 3-demethylubiquinone-9 3-methyltransferase (glyoxalase superfamily) [Nocardioides sp. J9]